MTTTHPEFGPKTTATEVAEAFAGGIKGRTCKSFNLYLNLNNYQTIKGRVE